MIPKIIHYCWLSDNPIPAEYQAYINEWKEIMPDYTFKKWDRQAIKLDEHPFAKEAFDHKKYAFAADYVRAYALYTEGGIYLDSDVKVLKRFDQYLKYSYFSSIENQLSQTNYKLLINRFIDKQGKRIDNKTCYFLGIQAAILGAEKGNALIGEILDFYKKQSFVDLNGDIFHQLAPIVHAIHAEKYGFVYQDKMQFLKDNIAIFPSDFFATKGIRNDVNTVAIHCIQASWVKKDRGIKRFLKRFKFIMDLHLKWIIITRKAEINLVK